MIQSGFRYELKYIISDGQKAVLNSRLKDLLSRDPHVNENGMYTVSSLYFDDYYNTCFYENENGIEPREKYRIRYYNHSIDTFILECKRKERGMTLKTSCSLPIEQAKLLIEGKMPLVIENKPLILQKLLVQMQQKLVHPVVIVDYIRIPFISSIGNVRITLDTNISSSNEVRHFIEGCYEKRPIMPSGQNLLEVKYDHFLPNTIYSALQLDNLQQIAYSKYYLCRKYSL